MRKLFRILSFVTVLTLVAGLYLPGRGQAVANSISLSPSSSSFSQYNTVSVDVHEDSGADAINAVQATLNYPSNLLKVASVTIASGWSTATNDATTSGTIRVAAFPSPPGTVTGDNVFATIVFQGLNPGMANLTFGCNYNASTCISGNALTRASDSTDILSSTSGTSLTVLGTDTLGQNQTLLAGQSLISFNVRFWLVMQGDGNLVLYGDNLKALWASRTNGTGANRVVMQGDGNLVLYTASNKPVWSSNTAGKGVSRLVMQDDGNLVVYTNSDVPTWYTRTGISQVFNYDNSNQLTANQSLLTGHYLKTTEGRHGLLMQPDGNLVLYGLGYHVLWASGTNNVGANRVVMQGDGNLVIYTAANKAVWYTRTNGTGADRAILQGDGNFVIYAGSTPKWWTGTNGKI